VVLSRTDPLARNETRSWHRSLFAPPRARVKDKEKRGGTFEAVPAGQGKDERLRIARFFKTRCKRKLPIDMLVFRHCLGLNKVLDKHISNALSLLISALEGSAPRVRKDRS
jgi:hypothetical protein